MHLTFAGLLAGLYQPVTTGEVSTTLWTWQWESTRLLRSVFITITALPYLPESPTCPDT